MASRRAKKNTDTGELADQLLNLMAGENLTLEDLLGQLAMPLLNAEEDEAVDRAKQVYYEACDAPTAKKRIELAKKAIGISPLCADAFVLLAEHEERASDAQLALYRKAYDAGVKSLGDSFEELKGEFWGWIETRPFMRAKLGLAMCLWKRNERAESLGHLRELLKLNPNDNQGVRSILAAYLIEEGFHDELAGLLKAYKDDTSADLGFSRALLAFRLHGECVKSRKALAAAIAQNEYVRCYITGQKKLPKTLPPYYSWGDDIEALHYAANFKKGWDQTPGAIEWLSGFSAPGKKAPAARKQLAAV